ncbi:PREDICTED: monocarboxylate transporter 13 isoform X2 [Papilio xuthus]|uniref:Monocarboxylate transporter 13 isoform X1 n=1 Tax=Papilio xuthus TaxID=66420 RepID=A0AAJ6Z179_PAPXU|nr:PREDICTED: monocarboxylate transporter 13 isoform X1 [Papilio xuthus]XP_013162966.1 PREDICTED: monocarboxylate transporter 13 isoform X2 [Papilio xuthus]
MAATAPISEGKETFDEAEEKLLDKTRAVIVANEDGQTTIKSSKKVKLPEDESPAVGAGRFTIGPAPERDWEMVPPDGKWGWFVLVGATLVNILIPGTIKSFGVLLVEFRDVFQASESASSGIVALCYFLYSSLGPISSILSVKWSYRTVTLIGGCFAAFGMIFSSLAFSIGYLYFSFGAMVGAGAGLAFPPTVYIVTSYFVRLRGLANGICMSGSAFGSIILPPLLRYLLETYGYKGAVLILGGVMLNVWAAALLFQPVEEHMVRKYKEPEEEDEVPQLEPFAEEDPIDLEASHPRLVLTSEDNTPTDKYPNGSPPIFKHKSNLALDDRSPNKLDFARSASAAQVMRLTDDRTRKISTSSRHGLSQISSKISNYLPSNPSLLESVPEGKSSRTNSHDTFGRKLTVPKTPKRSPSTSSFQYMSTPFHGSTLSAFEKPSEFASQFSLKSVTDSLRPITYCCGFRKTDDNVKKEPSKYFDVQLLKDPIYLVILISNCTCAISYTNFIILVPSYAVECGFDKSLGAYLLSIISALDLVGRIGGSAISDVVSTPKRYFFITGLLISGISLAMIPLMKSYLAISVFCSIFGIASGINVGVTALVMTEMLGTERLMSSYGISLFVNGILQLIGPPVCGVWFEYTHSYKSLFVTLGLILCSGAALWGFVPFIHSRRKKAERMQQNLEEKA